MANQALTQSQIQIASELEIEMMQDLYTRSACLRFFEFL